MESANCKNAGLMEVEAIWLCLYTGPAYVLLNDSLRNGLYAKGKKYCQPVITGVQNSIFDKFDEMKGLTLDGFCQWLGKSGNMSRVKKLNVTCSGWTAEEIRALVYTR